MNLKYEVMPAVAEVCKEVGAFISESRGKVSSAEIETKSLNSLVSFVDKTAETKLVQQLQKICPQSTFLTEEETVESTDGEWHWIIDPLDGTTNFLQDIPLFAISVALQHHGETVLAVVYEVCRDECFTAVKDGGAFLNGNRIKVAEKPLFADTVVATGFPYYDFSKAEAYLNTLRTLMTDTRGIRRMGAASVDLCYVACGRFDHFFEYSLAPWDVAAGALIVQEAGGYVYDFTKGDNWLYGKSIVAGSKTTENEMLGLIEKNFRK